MKQIILIIQYNQIHEKRKTYKFFMTLCLCHTFMLQVILFG